MKGETRMKHIPLYLLLLGTLLLLGCSIIATNEPASAYYPTQGWRSTTPEEQGLDSAKLAEGLRAIRDKDIHIHSLLVIRDGKILLDANFYPYDGKSLHRLASVTKSVMTTLIAIAAEQGKLNLDAPALSFFPDRTIANREPRKERMTVRQLAGMVNGMDSVCLANDEGTLNEMTASPDWVQFALDRKMTSEPGATFCYDSPGMHLLSAILQKATGMTALEFARQNLFEPLGIHDVLWLTDPQGYTHGWSDLYLHPRDAAKLGYLWLNRGMWDGKQIVSPQWVEDAVKAHIQTGTDDDYGYGWWVMKGDGAGQYAAVGRGGQRVQLVPALNVIIVQTGAGVEFDDVTSYLAAALVNPQAPLPANPNAVAKLGAALAAIAQSPTAKPLAPLPAIARQISGETIVFEPNPAQVKTMRLDFDDSAEAKMDLTFANNQPPIDASIGLDGVHRFTPGRNNLPVGVRGIWTDEKTFVAEYDDIAYGESYALQIKFMPNGIVMTMKERAHDAILTLTGKVNSD